MDPAEVADLRSALVAHEVVIVPSQTLSPGEQVGFSHLLGGFSPVPFVQPVPEHPEVIKVVKEASETEAFNFGGVWHSDFSFLDAPPAFTILHALDVPAVGGDTVWASMTAAHEELEPADRERLEEMPKRTATSPTVSTVTALVDTPVPLGSRGVFLTLTTRAYAGLELDHDRLLRCRLGGGGALGRCDRRGCSACGGDSGTS